MNFPQLLRATGLSLDEMLTLLGIRNYDLLRGLLNGKTTPRPEQVGAVVQLHEDMALIKSYILAGEIQPVPLGAWEKILVDTENSSLIMHPQD